jgi:hypothetical protein
MKKLVTIAAVLSLGLAMPLYAAEEKAADKPAADAPAADAAAAPAKVEAKDGKCMAGETEVTISKGEKGMEAKDKDGKAVAIDEASVPDECKQRIWMICREILFN